MTKIEHILRLIVFIENIRNDYSHPYELYNEIYELAQMQFKKQKKISIDWDNISLDDILFIYNSINKTAFTEEEINKYLLIK
jgi:hypothetical protein